MSRHERLMAQGLIAEKKRRLRELETEITALIPVAREAIPPFMDLDLINARLALDSTRRLFSCTEERKRVLEELQALQKEWGEP